MELLDKEDRVLTWLVVLNIIVIFILWICRDFTEFFNGGGELYQYSINITLGYIVSYIFI